MRIAELRAQLNGKDLMCKNDTVPADTQTRHLLLYIQYTHTNQLIYSVPAF